MLTRSNQLVGAGSVNMPIKITPGANPYSNNVFDFWKTNPMSNILKTDDGEAMRAPTPLDLRLLGTGILVDKLLTVDAERSDVSRLNKQSY